jgi:hypothetical protein
MMLLSCIATERILCESMSSLRSTLSNWYDTESLCEEGRERSGARKDQAEQPLTVAQQRLPMRFVSLKQRQKWCREGDRCSVPSKRR